MIMCLTFQRTDWEVRHPGEMLGFLLTNFPILHKVDQHLLVGSIQRHLVEKPKAHQSHPFLFDFISLHPPCLFSLMYKLKQKGMISFFNSQDEMHIVFLQLGNMWGVGTEGILGDDEVQPGIFCPQFGQLSLGCIAFTIVFLAPILFDNRFRRQWEHFSTFRVDDGCPQGLMCVGDLSW